MNVQEVKSTVFNDTTTVGKSGKAGYWALLTVILVGALTAITNNPQLFSWRSGLLVIVANVFLVLIKNLADKNTPNV